VSEELSPNSQIGGKIERERRYGVVSDNIRLEYAYFCVSSLTFALQCIDAGQHQKYWGMFDNNNDKKRNGEVGGALDEDDFAVLMARRRSKRREYGPWYRILCQTLFLSSIISYYPVFSTLYILLLYRSSSAEGSRSRSC
jgi:hypothetical protein